MKTESIEYHDGAGTPQTCLEKINFIKGKIHTNHVAAVFKYGGMPIAKAEENMRRFAATVMPTLHRDATQILGSATAMAAAD